MMYTDLIEEYKAIRGKLSQLSGAEHDIALMRLKEIDEALKVMERNIPRWTGGSTNYKNALTNILPELLQVLADHKKERVANFFIGCLVGAASVCLFLAIISWL